MVFIARFIPFCAAFLLTISGYPLRIAAQQGPVINNLSTFWIKAEAAEIFQLRDQPERSRNLWGVGLDYIYRRSGSDFDNNPFAYPLRVSMRPWVHYQFSPLARLSLSPIGYYRSHPTVLNPGDELNPKTTEWRTTLQYFHHVKQLGGRIMHTYRYRYELRWRSPEGENDFDLVNRFRFRYRFRISLNSDDFYRDKTWYTLVANEVHLQYGQPNIRNVFQQNRLYVGVGYRFLNAVRAEARYVQQLTSNASGTTYNNRHGLMLCLYVDQVSTIGSKDIMKVRFSD
jgi:hypothetical protein